MLTNAAVKAARPSTRAYKRFDERGLFLYVAPTGTRSFRMRFRLGGKEQLLTIGTYPEVTLDQARDRRDAAIEQLGRGEDPRNCSAAPIARTFEIAACAWHSLRRPEWTPIHAGDVLTSLERDVFPAIGALALGEVTRPEILALLRKIERRGAIETARRIQQRICGVFRLAMSEGWCDANPAEVVTEGLTKGRASGRHPALVDAVELRSLLAAVDAQRAAPAVVLASRFLALTAVRLAALRGARWEEIEDLDGVEPLWRVPAARMKLAAAKKLDPANDHLVPLSLAAVAVLRQARELGDGAGLIFAAGAGTAMIPERAIGDLYNRAGYAGQHVPHGWRASFSTILNEAMPDQRGAIDRALGHVGGGGVEAELRISRLHRIDVDVLRARLSFLDFATGRLFPSIEKIAERAGVHYNSVVGAIRRLRHHGLIDRVRRTTRTGNDKQAGPQLEQPSNAYFFDHRRRMAKRTWQTYWESLTKALRRLGARRPAAPVLSIVGAAPAPLTPLQAALASLGSTVAEREHTE